STTGNFPKGKSRTHAIKFPAKQKYYADLIAFLKSTYSPDQQIMLMGDMNISHQDCDIGIGEENRKRWLRTGKCSFLPEERVWLQELLQDRKSTRLNSSHVKISYAVFCLKKKKKEVN